MLKGDIVNKRLGTPALDSYGDNNFIRKILTTYIFSYQITFRGGAFIFSYLSFSF